MAVDFKGYTSCVSTDVTRSGSEKANYNSVRHYCWCSPRVTIRFIYISQFPLSLLPALVSKQVVRKQVNTEPVPLLEADEQS